MQLRAAGIRRLHRPSFSGDRGEFRRLVTRGRGARTRHGRLLSVLARHRHPPSSVVEHRYRRRRRGIHRPRQGIADRISVRARDHRADLSGLFPRRPRSRTLQGFRQLSRWSLFFYVFGQFAIYRARRYRLTRTVWRGVRFWMDGSGWAYAARAALWTLLSSLTLGLILPWREAALERYKMRHSYYGDLQGSFEGRGWEFFKRGWWLWLLAVCRSRLDSRARCSIYCRRPPGAKLFRAAGADLACARPSSTAFSKPSNGAGGSRASGSARCGSN